MNICALQVYLSDAGLCPLSFLLKKRVHRHARAGIRMAFRMRMHMPCGMQHGSGMHFHACTLIFMHPVMRRGSQTRFLRSADFGDSQESEAGGHWQLP